jgi:hypothetical protein
MPASEKQLAANRANATRSTGPRTPEGKASSSMNAVTHGLTAQTAVLRGEDRGQLEALSESLMRELAPRGVVQRLVAERIVSLTWKLRRVARAEEVVARQMDENAARAWERKCAVYEATEGKLFAGLGPKPGKRDGATILADSFEADKHSADDGRLVRITQYELKLDAALRAAVRELRQLQKDQAKEPPGDEEAPPVQNEPDPPSEARRGPEAGAGEAETPAVEETNPIPPGPDSAEVVGFTTVADETGAAAANDRSAETDPPGVTGAQSSAPAPGTSASPPPAPRR